MLGELTEGAWWLAVQDIAPAIPEKTGGMGLSLVLNLLLPDYTGRSSAYRHPR